MTAQIPDRSDRRIDEDRTDVVSDRRAPPQGGDLGNAARSSLIGLLGSAFAAVAGLLLNVVISRGLGAEASGVFFVVVAILSVAATLAKLGGDTGLVWALSRARALERTSELRRSLGVALLPSVAASVAFAVVVFMLAPWMASLVDDTGRLGVTQLLRSSAPFLIFAGPVLVLAAGLRGLGSLVGFSAVQNGLIPGLRPILAAAAIAAGLGVGGVLITWNLPLVLGVMIAAVLVRRRLRKLQAIGEHGTLSRSVRVIRQEFWRFSAPRAVTAAIEVTIVWADVILVAALTSPLEAGIYAAASRFITSGLLADAALRIAMAPQVTALLAASNLRAAGQLCGTATQWIVLLSWPIYLSLALYAPLALSTFGPAFVEGSSSLSLLAVAMLVMLAAGNNQTVLLMSGRSSRQLGNRILVLSLNLILNLLLIPGMGMWGAAIAWSASSILDAVLALVAVRRLVGVRIPMSRVAPAVVISVVAFVPIGLLAPMLGITGTWGSIGAILVSVVLFLGLLYVSRSKLDIAPLRNAIRSQR